MKNNSSFSFGHKPIFKSSPDLALKASPLERSTDRAAETGLTPKNSSANRKTTASDRTQATNAVHRVDTAPIAQPSQGVRRWSLKRRIAALMAVIAVPAMAAPNDFGELPGGAPTEAEMVSAQLQAELARNPAMPFERPGMSFPGSAFFFLADPPSDALIALPEIDALAEGVGEAGREVGAIIDAGPGANPFFGVGGSNQLRAQSCLAQAVWYEAASESEAGQRAVAQVVLNRVAHPNWPSSVCGVVYQGSSRRTGCQFTFTCDGSLRRKASGATWQRAETIASEALSGSVYAPIGHATHYHTLWINPYWASSLDHVGTVGAHRFYRNRGSGGRKDAFTQSYAGVEPGVNARVTAPPSVELPTLPSGEARVSANDAGYAPGAARPNAAQQSQASSSLDSGSGTGPGAALINPEVRGAGQVRDDFARAGQWKSDAARSALIEDEQRRFTNEAQGPAQGSANQGSANQDPAPN